MTRTKTRRRKSREAASRQPAEGSVKIAIDFPAPLYERTEEAVRELSLRSRSSLIRAAVEMYLDHWQRAKLERRIAESFLANADMDRRLVQEFKHLDVIEPDAE
jgi:metal-responsive CopG/Arc/MetJ family transcriptional regulator